MALITRTINPLHFEDLEPHRFEDLIRQLVYDFRIWQKLEATGRSGSDEGFDVRGWEIVPSQEEPVLDEDEGERETELAKSEDRIWLIQCKREKQIGPKKLEAYLDGMPESERTGLYGIIFTAQVIFQRRQEMGS